MKSAKQLNGDNRRYEKLGETEDRELRLRLLDTLYDLFQASLSHDFEAVKSLHWHGSEFTKIGATDALGISNYEEAMELEKHSFSNIENGQFFIDDFHYTQIDRVIVTAFILKVRGVYKPITKDMESRRRATVVFVETPSGLKIIHKHFSSFPIAF